MQVRSRPLSPGQVRRLVSALRNSLPVKALVPVAGSVISGLRRHVQGFDLGSQLKAVREARGQSIADAARAIKSAQYKLKALESGTLGSAEAGLLERYVAHLDLAAWFEEWLHINPSALESPLAPRRRRRSGGRRTTA
jgi:hypothetical protein